MAYNPFNKSIDELVVDDLRLLVEQQVKEGYFVEYKSEFPSNQKVAHSVASFANTYGGWYFIGVKTNKQNQADEICGFDLRLTPDPISKLRDIVKSHINPVPIFHQKLVDLPKGETVLVVYIPAEQDTPFVTKDGRIYRRNNDSSDPVPETDRHTIDRLVDAGRQAEAEFAEFCRDERAFSESEDTTAWLRVFISPYPRGILTKTDIILNTGLRHRLERTKTPVDIIGRDRTWFSSTIECNVIQAQYQSVILRNVETSWLAFNSFEIELFVDGSAKFLIPLTYFSDLSLHSPVHVRTERVKQLFQRLAADDPSKRTSHLRFLDIGRMWLVIAWCFGYYYDWIGADNRLINMRIAASLAGVWKSVPFFDSEEWAAQVEQSGLPVMGRETVSIPSRPGGSLWLGEAFNLRWLMFCHVIGFALGLPYELSEDILFKQVQQAAQDPERKI